MSSSADTASTRDPGTTLSRLTLRSVSALQRYFWKWPASRSAPGSQVIRAADSEACRGDDHRLRDRGAAMNAGRFLSCGDSLGRTSRTNRRTCADLCRRRLSSARRANRPASGAGKARGGAFGSRMALGPTPPASCERRGSGPCGLLTWRPPHHSRIDQGRWRP
jgi:hypothetical protein